MTAIGSLIGLALAAASPAPAPAQGAAPAQGFSSLWTSWSGVSRESLRAEAETARRAPAAGAGSLQPGSIALGERVGEIVRAGDCEEGERVARAAGDFPLVEAVRAHCRPAVPVVSRH